MAQKKNNKIDLIEENLKENWADKITLLLINHKMNLNSHTIDHCGLYFIYTKTITGKLNL